jgi:hypothetical protein
MSRAVSELRATVAACVGFEQVDNALQDLAGIAGEAAGQADKAIAELRSEIAEPRQRLDALGSKPRAVA